VHTRLLLAAALTVGSHLTVAATPVDAQPITQSFAISLDSCVDSRSPTFNYGGATTTKVVVNGDDGSLVRSLFKLPDELPPIPVEGLIAAKVWFYVWFDQTGDRNVRLHPLIRSFAEGSGDGTPADDGASWLTWDGVNLWATPGGDYDAATFVDAIKGTTWFSWDITALWSNEDLRAHGAILRMNDESNPGAGNMPRAPFTSSDGPVSQQPYLELTFLPCSLAPSPGDINGDCVRDAADVALFVEVLLGAETGAMYVVNGDLNGDGFVDGRDIQPFLDAYLQP
jgi:hypothetical protein